MIDYYKSSSITGGSNKPKEDLSELGARLAFEGLEKFQIKAKQSLSKSKK